MSKPSLYNITSREVSPVADLLKAVVEVNWHLSLANAQGWSVSLTIQEDDPRLGVKVERYDCWPTEGSEAEAEAEGLA